MDRVSPLFDAFVARVLPAAVPTSEPAVYVGFEHHGPLCAPKKMTRAQVVEYLRPDTCPQTRWLIRQMDTYDYERERIVCFVCNAGGDWVLRSEVYRDAPQR